MLRFDLNLDKSLQNFFQGISNRISSIKKVIQEERIKQKEKKIKEMEREKIEAKKRFMQKEAILRGRRPLQFYTILCTAVDLGVYPGGDYGGRMGQAFYVGTKGGYRSHMSYRNSKDSISHSMIMYDGEKIDMLKVAFSRKDLPFWFQQPILH